MKSDCAEICLRVLPNPIRIHPSDPVSGIRYPDRISVYPSVSDDGSQISAQRLRPSGDGDGDGGVAAETCAGGHGV